jgi:hypothetical protein
MPFELPKNRHTVGGSRPFELPKNMRTMGGGVVGLLSCF